MNDLMYRENKMIYKLRIQNGLLYSDVLYTFSSSPVRYLAAKGTSDVLCFETREELIKFCVENIKPELLCDDLKLLCDPNAVQNINDSFYVL